MGKMRIVSVSFLLLVISVTVDADIDAEEAALPTKCHVCKHLVQELQDELERSGKSKEVFQTGQIFQEQRKEINYQYSEVRLNEALENACSNVLDYKVHKDKVKALRYEKKESVTFNTLKGLKNRGVKVDLGFPYEMWDTPDAEVTRLKSRCELMVETYEDDLTQWYWHHQKENLTNWLCIERVLDPGEEECFNETEAKNTDDKRGSEGTEEKGKEGEDKNNDTDEDRERKKSGKEKKKGKGKEKDKNKGGKPSAGKSKRSSQAEEDDSEKIQRLIRQQAQEQEEHSKKRGRTKEFVGGKMDERKRREFQTRLRDIHDVDRLRRELRRIRQREMTEDDYSAREPWERHMDSSIPEEVRRDMRRHRFERMNDPEDLRRELRMRAMDLDDDDHFFEEHSFAFRELSHRYMIEAEEIRDPLELKKRIDDLDALSAIFSSGYERDRRRGRHGRRPWKDEF